MARVFFTAEDGVRFRQFANRLGSERLAFAALGVNQEMFANAVRRGRVLQATRERLLAKLDELERGEAAA